MRPTDTKARTLRFGAASVMLLGVVCGLAACSRAAHDAQPDLDWARAAVQRNGTLELLSVDPARHTLSVRIRATGQVRDIRSDELIAALPPSAGTEAADGTAAPSPPAASTAAAVPSAGGAPAAPNAPAQTASASENPPEASPAANADASPTESTPKRVAEIRPARPEDQLSTRKSVSGPGYSIAVVGGATAPVAAAATSTPTSVAQNVPVEHRHEPIICQGGQRKHIDNQNLQFDGDGLSAEDGCELHITNSHIAAQGTGVFARAASVHIENSAIEGDTSSINASDGAQVYVQSSTFKGVIRRVDSAGFHNLGGNVGY